EEIALQTRISTRFLAAIEAEDFERLPGALFTRNFVRQFAGSLGMDSQPMLAGLPVVDIESAPLPDPAQFARPPRPSRWRAALSSFAWVSLTAAACAGGYVYINQRQNPAPRRSQRAVSSNAVRQPTPVAVPPPLANPSTAGEPESLNQPVQVVL